MSEPLVGGQPRWSMLRVAPVRYLVAELITFGCLFLGIVLAREWQPVGEPAGALIALIGGTTLTVYYLYKVLGSSVGWIVPLTLLMVANTVLGIVIAGNATVYDAANPTGTRLVITGTYWIAWGTLLGAAAATVALAAASGERWVRRYRPRGEAIVHPRGSLAGRWFPASSPPSHR